MKLKLLNEKRQQSWWNPLQNKSSNKVQGVFLFLFLLSHILRVNVTADVKMLHHSLKAFLSACKDRNIRVRAQARMTQAFHRAMLVGKNVITLNERQNKSPSATRAREFISSCHEQLQQHSQQPL